MPTTLSLDDWIAREAVGFTLDSPDALNAAVDRIIVTLGPAVELLGFGEAMHGEEETLLLRNRLLDRLVERHEFTAIAIESSFPRGWAVNEYVNGRGTGSFDAICDAGTSHGFGRLESNRELVEWMRAYNDDASHRMKLQFYGFDSPTEMTGTDSPRQLLNLSLDYLASIDPAGAGERRRGIDELLGDDADWENPAAMMDPTKSIGLSPKAAALRVETEELVSELHRRRPELVSKSDAVRYLDAEQHASVARQLLTYHAGLARQSSTRTADLLGIRDLIMADNLGYMVERERRRGGGKVLAFAHNSHLKRGLARWQLGPDALEWWPAGAHVNEMLGSRYAVIGTGVGVSEAHGIGQPEAGTLEAHLIAAGGSGRVAQFIPTHLGQGLAASEVATLPTRSAGTKNPSYFPFTSQSLTDFDGLVVLSSTA